MPDRASESVKPLTEQQVQLLEESMNEFNAYIQSVGHDTEDCFIESDFKHNWVYQEMQQYLFQRGVQGKLMCHSGSRCDVLEVYCSSDSQLTKQSIRQGLRAIRFGLRDGDLSTF